MASQLKINLSEDRKKIIFKFIKNDEAPIEKSIDMFTETQENDLDEMYNLIIENILDIEVTKEYSFEENNSVAINVANKIFEVLNKEIDDVKKEYNEHFSETPNKN